MIERPILFSAPMVRALRDGRKTMTRRAVKPQPPEYEHATRHHQRILVPRCPYGQVGDRIWCREAFRLCAQADTIKPRDANAAYRVWYEADAPHQPGGGKLRPSMFMPRWASRILLEVVAVRVERLNEITRGDCMAEGCPFPNMAQTTDPRGWFSDLWESINGAGAWAANPWVWVIEFKRLP